MDIVIDERVLEKTTRCSNGFRCLSGGMTFLCQVVAPLGSDILEVKSDPYKSCSYGLSVGNTRYCHCPVRNEIYKLYKL